MTPPATASSEGKNVKSTSKEKSHRWYLGGVASAGAAACTHPLDLLKVCSQSLL